MRYVYESYMNKSESGLRIQPYADDRPAFERHAGVRIRITPSRWLEGKVPVLHDSEEFQGNEKQGTGKSCRLNQHFTGQFIRDRGEGLCYWIYFARPCY
jgi:hypothetical protein